MLFTSICFLPLLSLLPHSLSLSFSLFLSLSPSFSHTLSLALSLFNHPSTPPPLTGMNVSTKEQFVLFGHTGPISSIAVSADNSLLASAQSCRGSAFILVWDISKIKVCEALNLFLRITFSLSLSLSLSFFLSFYLSHSCLSPPPSYTSATVNIGRGVPHIGAVCAPRSRYALTINLKGLGAAQQCWRGHQEPYHHLCVGYFQRPFQGLLF